MTWGGALVVSASSQPVGALGASSSLLVITSGGSDGPHVSVGVQARTVVDNKFDVGSPSAMAPKWGQTGTEKGCRVCMDVDEWSVESPGLGSMWGHRFICRTRTC